MLNVCIFLFFSRNINVKSLGLIGLRTACALSVFHAVSMSHGDVKPENLGVKDLGCGLTIVLLDMATWSMANDMCPALGTLFFMPFYGNDSNLAERIFLTSITNTFTNLQTFFVNNGRSLFFFRSA